MSYLPKNIEGQISRGRRKFWRQKPDIMNLVATFPDGKFATGKLDNQTLLSHLEIVKDVTKEILRRNLIQTR